MFKQFLQTLRSSFIKNILALSMPAIVRNLKTINFFFRQPKAELEAYQIYRFKKILNNFYLMGWYREYANLTEELINKIKKIKDLNYLPVLTKKEISYNLPAIKQSKYAYKKFSTSGSMGQAFYFYISYESLLARRAAVYASYTLADIDYWGAKKYVVWGISKTDFKGQLKTTVNNFIINKNIFQAFGLNTKRALEALKEINLYRPDLIEGFPGYLRQLAEIGKAENIKIFKPKAIIVSGEMLLPKDCELLEAYFQAPVYNRYGSREFGPIAHECSAHKFLHIIPTRFIVENDEENNLIITDLDNQATPFIRYFIGDKGKISYHSCSCGLTSYVIENLEGRSNDYVLLPNHKHLASQFWTIILKKIPGVDEFQIIQDKLGLIKLVIKPNNNYNANFKQKLKYEIFKYTGEKIDIEINLVNELERTAMGKRKFIVNKLLSYE